MLASFLSLVVLALGLYSFARSAYLMGRDGLEHQNTRGYMTFGVSGVLVIALAGFLNKSLE